MSTPFHFLHRLVPQTAAYYPSRRSSISSSFRDFRVYHFQQRPWQSSPDLRLGKWKPSTYSLSDSLDDSTFDITDVIRNKKKHFLEDLLYERSAEPGSYRYWLSFYRSEDLEMLKNDVGQRYYNDKNKWWWWPHDTIKRWWPLKLQKPKARDVLFGHVAIFIGRSKSQQR